MLFLPGWRYRRLCFPEKDFHRQVLRVTETILMNRCKNEELFEQTVHLINDFKEYFLSHGEPVGENPSPGNKAGGISTLEEKALGCTQKCGKSYVSGVLPYGERLQKAG